MVCPINDIKARPLLSAQNDIDGDVHGPTAAELAKTLYDEITGAYSLEASIICGAWMGTVCDGAYQAADLHQP